MNASQRAQFATTLEQQFPAGTRVAVMDADFTGRNDGVWWVQARYAGQPFNKVQLLHSFFKKRVEVSPINIWIL